MIQAPSKKLRATIVPNMGGKDTLKLVPNMSFNKSERPGYIYNYLRVEWLWLNKVEIKQINLRKENKIIE